MSRVRRKNKKNNTVLDSKFDKSYINMTRIAIKNQESVATVVFLCCIRFEDFLELEEAKFVIRLPSFRASNIQLFLLFYILNPGIKNITTL